MPRTMPLILMLPCTLSISACYSASTTGFSFPGKCWTVQPVSAIAEIWRCCRPVQASEVLLRAWMIGLWSFLTVTILQPSKKCRKRRSAKKMARSQAVDSVSVRPFRNFCLSIWDLLVWSTSSSSSTSSSHNANARTVISQMWLSCQMWLGNVTCTV